MNEIKELSNERIGQFLSNHGLRWLRTDSGAFIVDVMTDFGGARLHLANEGEGESRILMVRVSSPVGFGPDSWPALLSAANSWNRDFRFAKAFVAFLDDETAIAVAEHQTPVGAGLHDELLDMIAGVALDECVAFHRFVSQQMSSARGDEDSGSGLPSADDLEGWLDRSA